MQRALTHLTLQSQNRGSPACAGDGAGGEARLGMLPRSGGATAALRTLTLALPLLLTWLVGITPVDAEEFSVGITDLDTAMDWDRHGQPGAALVRSSVYAALTERVTGGATQQNPGFRLRLADSVRVSHDQTRWSFRIRRGSRFQNGAEISPEDIVFSLNRCRAQGVLSAAVQSVAVEADKVPARNTAASGERWVEVALSPDMVGTGAFASRDLPAMVADCPVMEQATATLFGEDFNRGGNFVGSGAYRVVEIKAGKSVRLVYDHAFGALTGTAGAESLTLRNFSDSSHGLTALREGAIDILFVEPSLHQAPAASDETIALGACGGYGYIRRVGVDLGCEFGLNPTRFRRTH